MSLPPLCVRGITCPTPIIQGGMGVGVSLAGLAASVAREGGMGTISSACLDRLVGKRLGRKCTSREGAAIEVAEARATGGPIAMNVMVALESTYEQSVLGALDGGVDALVSGAGLPLRLPAIVAQHPRGKDVALIPIVSSARALRLLCHRWQKAGRIPDAAILEGPMAGGHLGWKDPKDIVNPDHRLEALLGEVLAVAKDFGDLPIIAAGGVYSHEDIRRMLSLGASGVQMGTRFLATVESSASEAYKRAVVECGQDEILIAQDPGSPCGLPFRILKASPMYQETRAGARVPRCDKGYVLFGGTCAAKEDPERYFCICNGLLSSAGFNGDEEPPLYTVGANAHRVDRILTVAELMGELRQGVSALPGSTEDASSARAA